MQTTTTPVIGPAGVAGLGTTLGVWAHPDDESYLSGGLMAALRDAGRRVVVVTATLGESGVSTRPHTPWDGGPARTRSDELAAALRHLGVREYRVLGLPDGGCAGADPVRAVAAIAAVIAEVRPDTVVSFGPDGATGHPDHVAVGAWTRAAVDATGATGRRPRLLQPVITDAELAAGRDVTDVFGVYALGEPRVVAPAEVAVRLDLSGDLLERKVAALRAHRSQTALLLETIGAERFAAWVGVETFAAA